MTPSILVSRTNYDDFMKLFNLVLLHITQWVQSNQLILSVDKRSIIRFTPTKFSRYPLNLVYPDQAVTELDTQKFLSLRLDNHLMWKPYIGFIFCKWGTSCIIIRLSHLLSSDTIKTACYSYFCLLIKYGIIFWRNSRNITKVGEERTNR
jgi:hypothetical protein